MYQNSCFNAVQMISQYLRSTYIKSSLIYHFKKILNISVEYYFQKEIINYMYVYKIYKPLNIMQNNYSCMFGKKHTNIKNKSVVHILKQWLIIAYGV